MFTPYESPGLMTRDLDPVHCQTARAPDYYGLGVRMGIYFAWFQCYLANTFLPSEMPSALDTNMIFLLVIAVAMIKCSSVHMLGQIDGLILMHLAGGTIFGVLSIWGYRTRMYKDDGPKAIRFFGGFGTHGRLIVSLAVSIFGLWYWMFAVTGGLFAMGDEREEQEEGEERNDFDKCGTLYTFMFGQVRADGGIRIFYMIVCICCIIYFGFMFLASSLTVWAKTSKVINLSRTKSWADSSKLRYATGLKYRELDFVFRVLRVLNLLWLIFSMLLVEFTLNFNHVTAVLGGPFDNELHLPAQLLPLLIGAFGLVRISYLLLQERRSPGHFEPSLSAPATSQAARTMNFGAVSLLQAFSPAMARAEGAAVHDPEEIDVLERRRSTVARYFVAWLPWLSLLERFHGEDSEIQRAKRLSEASHKRDDGNIELRDQLQLGQRQETTRQNEEPMTYQGMPV